MSLLSSRRGSGKRLLTLMLAPALLSGAASAADIKLLALAEIASETGAGPSYPAAVSIDGRYVLLRSVAPNLIAGQVDENGAADLFLRDRTTAQLTLITHRAGEPWRSADQGSRATAMSPDADWVLFESWATDLVADQQSLPFSTDVYLWQRSTGATVLVSHLAGQPLTAAGQSRAVAMTPNGAFVLFDSSAPGITAGDDNDTGDVFLFERATGVVRLVSATPAGTAGDARSWGIGLQPGGGQVLFNSYARDLTASPYANGSNSFLRNVAGASTSGPLLAGGASATAWTPDGRYLLGQRGHSEVLIFDRQSQNERIVGSGLNVAARKLSADGGSALFTVADHVYLHRAEMPQPLCLSCRLGFWGEAAALSSDGAIAAFYAITDTFLRQAFYYDAETGDLEPITRHGDGTPLAQGGEEAVMTADGRFFAFAARERQLDPRYDDRNGHLDSFLFERGEAGLELLSPSASARPVAATLGHAHGTIGGPIGGASILASPWSTPGAAGLSFSGDEVLFNAPAHLLDPGNPLDDTAAFAYHLYGGARRLLSPRPGDPQTPARGYSKPLALARDGAVLLVSDSPDLAPSLLGAGLQLYLRQTDGAYRLVTEKADSPGHGSSGYFESVRADRDLRKVLLTSTGTDLAGLPPEDFDLHLYRCDLVAGGCRLLSHRHDDPDIPAFGGIGNMDASADLTTAAFTGYSPYLVPDGILSFRAQAYVYSEGRPIELLSRSAVDPTMPANNSTYTNDISADGRFVLASSYATDILPGLIDGNGARDVFVFDRLAGSWELISSSALGPQLVAGRASWGLDLSADGRFVLFTSEAADLFSGQIDISTTPLGSFPLEDVFLFDRATGEKRLVSHRPGQSTVAAGWSGTGALAESGRRAVFRSFSPDLLPGSPSSRAALHLWDAASDATVLLYADVGGPYPESGATPILGQNRFFSGGVLPFDSRNDNTVTPGDSNGANDGFVLLLDLLFADGFEAGDTSAWTSPTI